MWLQGLLTHGGEGEDMDMGDSLEMMVKKRVKPPLRRKENNQSTLETSISLY